MRIACPAKTVSRREGPLQPPDRAKFDAAELAVVLSHYDLGVIESVTEFPRGSRRSPKVGIVCEKGKFLLKRRSSKRAEPQRVELLHELQKHLAAKGFPIARLIPTRHSKSSFVQQRDCVYELFEFVTGQPYERTKEETYDAGKVLAQFHLATEDFHSPHALPVPHGDFHDSSGVRSGLHSIGSTLSSHDSFSGDEAELATLVQFLLETYDRAAEIASSLRLAARPERIIHSDWHPGNVLYRKQCVAAVVDYDSVRLSKRVLDVANGALQFSMIAGGDPATWPPNLDEERYDAFLAGYESLLPIDDAERACIPPLMTEALIAECVPPITETGSVGQWAGFRVLLMVRRKLRWIMTNAPRLGCKHDTP